MNPVEIGSSLRRPELLRLFESVRLRLESNGLRVSGSVSVTEPSRAERVAIARLLGSSPSKAKSVRVPLEALDRALQSSRLGMSLCDAIEVLSGPLVDRRADAERRRQDSERMWLEASLHRAVASQPLLSEWLERLRSTGLLTRVARERGESTLARVLDVLAELPSDGTRLNLLATRLFGDAHELDRDRPTGLLATNALAFLEDVRAPVTAEVRRELWAGYGVACDDLSCDVLVLGVRPTRSSSQRAIAALANDGEPARVTLRQLLKSEWRLETATVYVCENPVIVAEAADRIGPTCAPLVCVEGVPNTAARILLAGCAREGISLRYHGDFDWAGIRIGNMLVERLPVEPWRYRATDYLNSCEAERGVHLAGAPVDAAWDGDLRAAMEEAAIAVYEEQVIDELVDDLSRSEDSRSSQGSRALSYSHLGSSGGID